MRQQTPSLPPFSLFFFFLHPASVVSKWGKLCRNFTPSVLRAGPVISLSASWHANATYKWRAHERRTVHSRREGRRWSWRWFLRWSIRRIGRRSTANIWKYVSAREKHTLLWTTQGSCIYRFYYKNLEDCAFPEQQTRANSVQSTLSLSVQGHIANLSLKWETTWTALLSWVLCGLYHCEYFKKKSH